MTAAPTRLVIDRIQIQQIATDCMAYMLYHDDSGKGFVFPIYFDSAEGDVEWGRTYTYAEMNHTYTYWMLSDYWTHALYTTATFMKEVTDGYIYIEATASDTNGDDWELIYDEQAQEELAVQNVPSANGGATKRLEKGRLIIEQNGIRYNATGAVEK